MTEPGERVEKHFNLVPHSSPHITMALHIDLPKISNLDPLPPPSASGHDGPPVFAFDFDKCVLARHSYGEGLAVEDVTEMSKETFASWWACLEDFKAFLETKKEAPLYIASFGRKEVIAAFLLRAKIEGYFRSILTPGDYEGYADGVSMGNKNAMLSTIHKAHPDSTIHFFDDDPRNVVATTHLEWVLGQQAAPLSKETLQKFQTL